ncbi:hypothetical protein L218DRAFT_990848 [Marasmius fiardii PR-910]|nr:hypothetical protein L218DRAFT_990848 [Marasmius fiardii PR-910]
MRNMKIEKAEFIALWMETLLYGINTVLFCICVYVLIQSRAHRIFLAATVAMYTICTVHVVVDFVRGIGAFFGSDQTAMGYYTDPRKWSNLFRQALRISNILIADSLLIYRLYIIWGYIWWIVILPILFLIGFSVSGYLSIWLFTQTQPGQNVFDTNIPMCSLIGYAMSLSTNIIVTSLIAGRIWWNTRKLAQLLGTIPHGWRYCRAISIIIESGAIISASVLVMIVLYSLHFNAPYVTDSIAQIAGIAPTLIIVRVGMGYSVESEKHPSSGSGIETGLSSIRFARPQVAVTSTV